MDSTPAHSHKRPLPISIIGYLMKISSLVILVVIIFAMILGIAPTLGGDDGSGYFSPDILVLFGTFLLGLALVEGILTLVTIMYANALLRMERKAYIVFMGLLLFNIVQIIGGNLYLNTEVPQMIGQLLIPGILVAILYNYRYLFTHEGDKKTTKRAYWWLGAFLIAWVITAVIIISAIAKNVATDSIDSIGSMSERNPAATTDDIMANYRNAERERETEQLLSGIKFYITNIANGDSTSLNLSTCPKVEEIDGNFYGPAGNATLESILSKYVAPFPHDPQADTVGDYTTCITSTGIVSVSAPAAESGKKINIGE